MRDEGASDDDDPGEEGDMDVEIQEVLRARMRRIYGSPNAVVRHEQDNGGMDEAEAEVESEDGEQEFEFRLFASSNKQTSDGGGGVNKIVLGDDEEDIGEGGFIRGRDPRVFIIGRAEGERKLGFQQMSRSGEEVLRQANRRAWGLEVPWRVSVIRIVGERKFGNTFDTPNNVEEDGGEAKRKRPGKKRRILLRGRRKKIEDDVERRRLDKERKEETEREKRTRRNREKKVKKKLKEKAKKTGMGEGDILEDNKGIDSDKVGVV